jgi:hypothetical protein
MTLKGARAVADLADGLILASVDMHFASPSSWLR